MNCCDRPKPDYARAVHCEHGTTYRHPEKAGTRTGGNPMKLTQGWKSRCLNCDNITYWTTSTSHGPKDQPQNVSEEEKRIVKERQKDMFEEAP